MRDVREFELSRFVTLIRINLLQNFSLKSNKTHKYLQSSTLYVLV